MAKHCEKCGGLLVQGTETCIMCGKTIARANVSSSLSQTTPVVSFRSPVSIPDTNIRIVTHPGGKAMAVPKTATVPPVRQPVSVPGPQIRFVTAPGGRRVEGSSAARAYKTT